MDISAVYFPSAVALGALHALEPGHAKTLTAAYLIGTKGTKRDAVLLGLSVAFTHSIVVVGLCVGAVLLGREAFTDEAARWLAVVSGAVVVALGVWLLVKRLRLQRRAVHIHARPHDAPGTALVGTPWGDAHIDIIGSPDGERMRVVVPKGAPALTATVAIHRGEQGYETLPLQPDSTCFGQYQSTVAPAEPHEFSALLTLESSGRKEEAAFHIHEPHDHHHGEGHDHGHPHTHDRHDEHDHENMTDDEHARAHAATLPKYVGTGARPTPWQVIIFGAAGGMIPCPAAITVMLLSISVAKTANGLFLVAGFSIGLAITLVGIGLAVVMGLSKLSGTDRFSAVSRYAPVISSSLVIVSGAAGLIVALVKGH